MRQLVGFERLTLAPDESRDVEFSLGFQELSFLDANAARVVEPGTQYERWVGDSSEATQHARFVIGLAHLLQRLRAYG